jgi:peptidoglycan/xylan/chitin deacetylase (PgdA/CDA1 family)
MSWRSSSLVLCYHALSDDWPDPLAIRPAAFERQLRALRRRGYRPAPLDEILQAGGRRFHVTFDDAFTSVLHALPILESLRVPATIFVCSGFADDGRPLLVPELVDRASAFEDELATMDWDLLRDVAERGVEIGSHTVSHAHLTRLSDPELESELRESRERLEANLGRRCRYLAYPYGEEDSRVRKAARAAGYEAGFSLRPDDEPVDVYGVPRLDVYRRDGVVRFALKVSSGRKRIAEPIGSSSVSRSSDSVPPG